MKRDVRFVVCFACAFVMWFALYALSLVLDWSIERVMLYMIFIYVLTLLLEKLAGNDE